jgi:hypothetical protein
MRDYNQLVKLAYKAVDETGISISDVMILAEMEGLKEERKKELSYKATQLTEEECLNAMIKAAESLIEEVKRQEAEEAQEEAD